MKTSNEANKQHTHTHLPQTIISSEYTGFSNFPPYIKKRAPPTKDKHLYISHMHNISEDIVCESILTEAHHCSGDLTSTHHHNHTQTTITPNDYK